ncbi:MAG: apolipoprotein N-acyltransferase [Pirellulales bacterium]|nr:apolipoprotein N-acyltransferase [Pirellulales bacterium]
MASDNNHAPGDSVPGLRSVGSSTIGLAATGAFLLWAALPPLDLWPLAWAAPVPWVLLVGRPNLAGRRPYLGLWLVGFLFWLAAIHWLRLPDPATSLGWLALSFYLGFYLPVFVGLGRVAVHRLRVPVVLAAPVVWTGLELARAHLITGFSMGALGHTQYRWTDLIQISDLGGAYAVDFVVMCVAACLARMMPLEDRRPAWWPALPIVLILAATVVYGRMRIALGQAATDEPPVRIALIQGSIDSTLKYDETRKSQVHGDYLRLSHDAVDRYGRLDLIVWPETMFRSKLVTFDGAPQVPASWNWSPEQFTTALAEASRSSREAMASLAEELGAPLLLGVDTEHYGARGLKRYNSAAHVTRDGRLAARYDKMHRVMFGEYVPFAERFPWLQDLTPLPSSITAGRQPVALDVGRLRISPNICYETVLAHVIRRHVTTLARAGQEPDVLVNLTNDGWFWGSSELDMHLACGVFRAVETRKPLLIAANTGFSAWIDADGRILAKGPRRAEDVLLAEVRPDPRKSWYVAFGDVPASLCLFACFVLAAAGFWKDVGRSSQAVTLRS